LPGVQLPASTILSLSRSLSWSKIPPRARTLFPAIVEILPNNPLRIFTLGFSQFANNALFVPWEHESAGNFRCFARRKLFPGHSLHKKLHETAVSLYSYFTTQK
jgi:hypothetical protein